MQNTSIVNFLTCIEYADSMRLRCYIPEESNHHNVNFDHYFQVYNLIRYSPIFYIMH
jgi:hypothetical protein